MKSILTTFLLLAAGSTISLAQCDKKVSLTSSKTQHLDNQGALKHAEDEKTTVEFSQSDIAISINGDNGEHKLTGKVKSDSCNWKVPFKDGKTKLQITLSNEEGESRDYTVTIEGKDGKVTLLAESPDEPDEKIRLDVDKFEEKN
ncbi:MAG: hypothetical protein JST19_03135 [Bacteroidetes bacterium]|nr:hypothetical protein [Bacteroidota bacterium]